MFVKQGVADDNVEMKLCASGLALRRATAGSKQAMSRSIRQPRGITIY